MNAELIRSYFSASNAIRTADEQIVKSKAAMLSSAKLCLSDARDCFDNGDYDCAYTRAKNSLAYSVGVFHSAYQSI